MDAELKLGAIECSRRLVLKKAAVTAAGLAVLGAAAEPAAAAAKASQKAVAYQDAPHGAQQCDNCRQFEAPSSCKVVDGTVSAKGWCKVYVKKAAA